MPADGADQTTRTFWTRWRVDIRAPLTVRLLTYAPSAQRRPAGEKTTAAQGPSNIVGQLLSSRFRRRRRDLLRNFFFFALHRRFRWKPPARTAQGAATRVSRRW